MKFWFVAVVLVLFLENAFSWKHSSERVVNVESTSWLEWFYDTFYKIFYVVLMSAILVCAFYNFFKNKLGKKSDGFGWGESFKEIDAYSKVLSLIQPEKSGVNTSEQSGDSAFNFSESENQLRQRLRQTQEEIQSLRNQLTLSMDNKTELESNLAVLDKERMSSEIQLEMDRVQGVLELEKIKKENLLVKREIQKLLEEKELAVLEVERLERDVRISRSAAVDADYLEERLVSVRREAEVLKNQFSQLALEKEEASVLVEPPSTPCSHGDMEFDNEVSWTAPDFAREYMTLD